MNGVIQSSQEAAAFLRQQYNLCLLQSHSYNQLIWLLDAEREWARMPRVYDMLFSLGEPTEHETLILRYLEELAVLGFVESMTDDDGARRWIITYEGRKLAARLISSA